MGFDLCFHRSFLQANQDSEARLHYAEETQSDKTTTTTRSNTVLRENNLMLCMLLLE